MEAIILAGGLGTRLRSVISDIPKSMAPISGHPFLSILLYNLSLNGFSRVILSVGYKYPDIMNYFGKKFYQLELIYVIENEPLGTGGAIRNGLKHIISDHAHVLNGDTFIDLDFNSIEGLWNTHKKTIVSVTEVPDTFCYGKVIESNGFIHKFIEKGISGRGLINCGAYVFEKNELNYFDDNMKFSIENAYLNTRASKFELMSYISSSEFYDIGTPKDYFVAQNKLIKYLPVNR